MTAEHTHPFFSSYADLKRAENWSEIISSGLRALEGREEVPLQSAERIDIYNILATNHHYTGQYNETIKYANLVEQDGSATPDQKARSLYLGSAAYRSLAQKEPHIESHKHNALECIEKALLLETNSQTPLTDKIRAKIFFNAGALYHDVFCFTLSAKSAYQKAMGLCEKGSDDYNRTALRYIRIILESGRADEAEKDTSELRQCIDKDSKTWVHFLQLQSKIYIAQGRYADANGVLEEATICAGEKGMNGDISRLNVLKDSIAERVPPGSAFADVVAASKSSYWAGKLNSSGASRHK